MSIQRRVALVALLVAANIACDDAKTPPHADAPVDAPARETTPKDRIASLQAELGVIKAFDAASTTALRNVENTGIEQSRTPPTELVRPDTRAFTVFFGANNHGERNDCGCRKNPLGGLGRRHTMLNALTDPASEIWRDQGAAVGPVFHVDAGDALFKHNTVDQQIERIQTIARYDAESVAAGLATIPLDAVVVGEHDVVLGLDLVTKLGKQHGLPLISANLKTLHEGTSELVFPPSTVVERDGLRVAFIGITQPQSRRHEYYKERNLVVDDPHAAFKAASAQLGEVDAVVLLSNLGLLQTRALVKQLRADNVRVDAALISGTNRLMSDPEFSGGVPVIEPHSQGKYLGRADIWLNGAEPAHYANATTTSPARVRDYRRAVRSYWTSRRQLGVEQLKIAEGELVLASLEQTQQPDVGEAASKLVEQRGKDLDALRKRLPTLEKRLASVSETMLQFIAPSTVEGGGDDWIATAVVPVKIEYVGEPATRKVLDPREKDRPQ